MTLHSPAASGVDDVRPDDPDDPCDCCGRALPLDGGHRLGRHLGEVCDSCAERVTAILEQVEEDEGLRAARC